jgi:hypothetical protein
MLKLKKPWFGTKKYGWGWGLPKTWQGWAVLIIYFIFIFCDFNYLNGLSDSAYYIGNNYVPHVLIASFVLIFVAFLTGETPKWRWGEK